MKINQEGINLIKAFEGILDGNPATVNLDPYLCPAGYWTVGWGHVVRDRLGNMIQGKKKELIARHWVPGGITMVQAEKLLQMDLYDYEQFVIKLAKVPLNENQFSALVSFCFNLGPGNLEKSTLLKKLNKGNYEGAAEEFKFWINANGRPLAGLERRRKAEKELFLKPVNYGIY
jgi:lysozyme